MIWSQKAQRLQSNGRSVTSPTPIQVGRSLTTAFPSSLNPMQIMKLIEFPTHCSKGWIYFIGKRKFLTIESDRWTNHKLQVISILKIDSYYEKALKVNTSVASAMKEERKKLFLRQKLQPQNCQGGQKVDYSLTFRNPKELCRQK